MQVPTVRQSRLAGDGEVMCRERIVLSGDGVEEFKTPRYIWSSTCPPATLKGWSATKHSKARLYGL